MKQFRLIIHHPTREILPAIIEAEDIDKAGSIAERLIRDMEWSSMMIQYSVQDSSDTRFYSITI